MTNDIYIKLVIIKTAHSIYILTEKKHSAEIEQCHLMSLNVT